MRAADGRTVDLRLRDAGDKVVLAVRWARRTGSTAGGYQPWFLCAVSFPVGTFTLARPVNGCAS